MGLSPSMYYVTTGHVEVEQAPFESAIASCYMAILSIEHNNYYLCQKFDLEAVAIASSELTVFVKSNRQIRIDGSELHDMHT